MSDIYFTKENLDNCLKELSKEFRKLNGRQTPAEIILIGGASVLINYGFREKTYDMDAIIRASSSMKDAINRVGDKMGLPDGWINTDFIRTASYTPKLIEHSKYYKMFSNVLTIRTISAEYLIAMKLMAGRQYKNDLSDVVGILLEQQKRGEEISLDQVKRAVQELYDDYEKLPKISRNFIESVFKEKNLTSLYEKVKENEKENKSVLIDFQNNYPNVLNEDNLSDILRMAKAKERENSFFQ